VRALNRILEIDPHARIARLEPGVPNCGCRKRLPRMACITHPTPPPRSPAPSAANVAENSGGVHCLKYGLTVHNVLGVRGYTMEGDLLELGRPCAPTVRAWTCWRSPSGPRAC